MQTIQSGGYELQLSTPKPLIEGEQNIEIKITKDGNPVASMPVKVMAKMDKTDSSMTMGMDKVKAEEKVLTESAQGNYAGNIMFKGSGKWIITVMFGDMQKTSFEVMVEKEGANWYVIGGFLGIILLFITIAVIAKKRG